MAVACLFFVGVAVGVGVVWPKYVEGKKREALFAEVGQEVRKFNGLLEELLDPSAKLSRGQYLEKAGRRTSEIDSALAHSLALDDSALPGTASLLANYGRNARKLVDAFSDDVRKTIALEMADANFEKFRRFENDPNLQTLMKQPHALLQQRIDAAQAAVKNEPDDFKQVVLLKEAADLTNAYSLLVDYQKAERAVRLAQAAKDESVAGITSAGEAMFQAGSALNDLTGQAFPIKKWGLK